MSCLPKNHGSEKKCRACTLFGEVMDVTGWLGGYNFQWAWSSGYSGWAALLDLF